MSMVKFNGYWEWYIIRDYEKYDTKYMSISLQQLFQENKIKSLDNWKQQGKLFLEVCQSGAVHL